MSLGWPKNSGQHPGQVMRQCIASGNIYLREAVDDCLAQVLNGERHVEMLRLQTSSDSNSGVTYRKWAEEIVPAVETFAHSFDSISADTSVPPLSIYNLIGHLSKYTLCQVIASIPDNNTMAEIMLALGMLQGSKMKGVFHTQSTPNGLRNYMYRIKPAGAVTHKGLYGEAEEDTAKHRQREKVHIMNLYHNYSKEATQQLPDTIASCVGRWSKRLETQHGLGVDEHFRATLGISVAKALDRWMWVLNDDTEEEKAAAKAAVAEWKQTVYHSLPEDIRGALSLLTNFWLGDTCSFNPCETATYTLSVLPRRSVAFYVSLARMDSTLLPFIFTCSGINHVFTRTTTVPPVVPYLGAGSCFEMHVDTSRYVGLSLYPSLSDSFFIHFNMFMTGDQTYHFNKALFFWLQEDIRKARQLVAMLQRYIPNIPGKATKKGTLSVCIDAWRLSWQKQKQWHEKGLAFMLSDVSPHSPAHRTQSGMSQDTQELILQHLSRAAPLRRHRAVVNASGACMTKRVSVTSIVAGYSSYLQEFNPWPKKRKFV